MGGGIAREAAASEEEDPACYSWQDSGGEYGTATSVLYGEEDGGGRGS